MRSILQQAQMLVLLSLLGSDGVSNLVDCKNLFSHVFHSLVSGTPRLDVSIEPIRISTALDLGIGRERCSGSYLPG
ncbi:hypothetical protein EJ06DRAFT_534628 [Trichodelitschia bisporula]|uniref:Secreted protein n=1 Tax=Trichodelitschia bisporula TaxID=703511 RepID=A0A6G1HIV4_9PEZI|nr:hypothetical protein EJ06DRAFT_534628 [Trichodelitschia bisporula]